MPHFKPGSCRLDTCALQLPWTAVALIVKPIAGLCINKVGEQKLIFYGLLIQSLGMLGIYLAVKLNSPYSIFIWPLLIAGGGVSVAIPAAQNVVISSVAAGEIGKASGTFSMLRQLSAVFGIALLVTVFARTGSFSTPQTFKNGFAPVIGVAAALSFMGAITSLTLPGKGGTSLKQSVVPMSKMKEEAMFAAPDNLQTGKVRKHKHPKLFRIIRAVS